MITTYDQSLGIIPLIERAVGPNNLGNVNPDITPERFPLPGSGVRTVQARVNQYRNGASIEQAAALTATGCNLASTADLAGFLHDHPEEVEKWAWVLALNADSRWSSPVGRIFVPCVRVFGANRYFDLREFRPRITMPYRFGVLVVDE